MKVSLLWELSRHLEHIILSYSCSVQIKHTVQHFLLVWTACKANCKTVWIKQVTCPVHLTLPRTWAEWIRSDCVDEHKHMRSDSLRQSSWAEVEDRYRHWQHSSPQELLLYQLSNHDTSNLAAELNNNLLISNLFSFTQAPAQYIDLTGSCSLRSHVGTSYRTESKYEP